MAEQHLSSPPYPGDEILPSAVMVYDQTRIISATPADIWPWIVQLGKGRGGWYCPASWEKWMPVSWRASRTINPTWQDLKPGDRVDDYGLSVEDYFDVVAIEPRKYLMYKSDRYGASFTWTLMLHHLEPLSSGTEARTLVHLRFRGSIAATGWKQRVLVAGGRFMDSVFTWPMLQGMAERVERSHAD
ncbi:hypothetical protein LTR56_008093 [Elasticomyces elasticus]|nr:hypothetical protein LTR56_008093 [Elasticomyces elasticus]KAK3662845.1 hypothetical protein LTR22_006248 [Elasticomyces elasticus]KAK4930040.1 hypothetical protein LTR49_003368 [Elasticomyces elasticus]